MKLRRAHDFRRGIRHKNIKIDKNKENITLFRSPLSIYNRNLTKLNRDSLRAFKFYSIRKVIPHFTHDKISFFRETYYPR